MNIFDLIEIPAPPQNLAGEEQPLRQGGPPCGSQDVPTKGRLRDEVPAGRPLFLCLFR